MTIVSNPALQAQQFALMQALGPKRLAGTFTLVPDGIEAAYLLFKQFPVPFLSPSGEAVEVPEPGGGAGWQASPPNTRFQGSVMLMETQGDALRNFVATVTAAGGMFDATIYDGTMDAHRGGWKIKQVILNLDVLDADWENRTALANVPGTVSYRFFGESVTPTLVG